MPISLPRKGLRRGVANAPAWLAGIVLLALAAAAPPTVAPPNANRPAAPPADEDLVAPPSGPAIIRDGFESDRIAWNQEQNDGEIELLAHDRSKRAAHEGRQSEHFKFNAGVGSGFYFSYALPKVPVTDALKANLYVRANRAGVQLFARVVLPADVDPDTKQPSFLLVSGTAHDNPDRWERLEVVDLRRSLERQARVLRASSKRPVSLEGAYVEQLVVNLFTAAGETEVFLDELSIGPVPPEIAAAAADPDPPLPEPIAGGATGVAANPGAGLTPPELPSTGPADAPAATPSKSQTRTRLDRNRLKNLGKDGLYHDSVFTAVYAPGADVASLFNAGFNVLIDDVDADPKRWAEAASKGMLAMPRFGRPGGGGEPLDPNKVFAAASQFPTRESVLAWDLGDRLGLIADPEARKAELQGVRATINKLRGLPTGVSRLTTGVVSENLFQYANSLTGLSMIGIRPNVWGAQTEPNNILTFFQQRRMLTVRANAGGLFWAAIPATAPRSITSAVWGNDTPPAWGMPMIQPEQLRLMTYTAMAAGYRGFAYEADADLTRDGGRMNLIELGLLNAEIDLCESIIANGSDPIPLYWAYDPDPSNLPTLGASASQRVKPKPEQKPVGAIRGAAIGTRDRKGVLLVVSSYAGGNQFQPAQLARNEIKLTVSVPEGAEAFEISPGRFRALNRERTVGGTRFTIPEFDTTALLLITTDIAMAERVEAAIQGIAPYSVPMAIEQAERKLNWVTEISGRLAVEGHNLVMDKERKKRLDNGGPQSTDLADLLAAAQNNIKAARENAERLDWPNAWSEARRASRPMRMIMRGLWQNAEEAMIRANTPPDELANEEAIKLNRYKVQGPPRLVPAVSSAPLVAFNTLPQHYLWVDAMKSNSFGRNLVPGGSFDDPDALRNSGWSDQSFRLEGIKASISAVPIEEGSEHRMIKMSVEPARKGIIDTLPAFLNVPAAAIRSPAVQVKAGQFLRVSVLVRRDITSGDGAGGIIVRDSIGGEALQFLTPDAIPRTSRVILYRRAPADGEFTVMLGLSGYGDAYFDDLVVERLEAGASPEGTGVARLPRPDRPASSNPSARRPAASRGTAR